MAWYTDAETVIKVVPARDERVPVFLMAERETVKDIPAEVIATINSYISKVEDTPDFVAGRVSYATQRESWQDHWTEGKVF